MNTIHTSLRLTTIDRWLAPHVATLIDYADSDPVFGLTLATLIQEENWSVVDGPTVMSSSHLLPADFAAAEDILDWLMYELITHPEARVSRSLLTSWTQQYEAPQDLIWGLALTDTFGPTVTGLPKKNRSLSQLQIVVDATWRDTKDMASFAEITHILSQEVIALELRKAGGKIGSLHPHTAEWCMGGAATKLYEADQKKLDLLLKTAMAEGLHHKIISDNEQVVALAISPSVNDGLVKDIL